MRKVNELLREVIAEEVGGLKDPRIGFVTITGVDTAPDLRHATVYYTVLGTPEEAAETGAALQHAHSRFQRAIASQVRMRYTPVLEFQVDEAVERGLRINQILHDLEVEQIEREEADEE
jgi:ribosome-binding factor A